MNTRFFCPNCSDVQEHEVGVLNGNYFKHEIVCTCKACGRISVMEWFTAKVIHLGRPKQNN